MTNRNAKWKKQFCHFWSQAAMYQYNIVSYISLISLHNVNLLRGEACIRKALSGETLLFCMLGRF